MFLASQLSSVTQEKNQFIEDVYHCVINSLHILPRRTCLHGSIIFPCVVGLGAMGLIPECVFGLSIHIVLDQSIGHLEIPSHLQMEPG